MTEPQSPADLARSIDAARQRLTSFVQCTEAEWRSAPVAGDPRPVGVIADHVAHAYEYLARWIGDLASGKPVEVNAAVVDELNAGHAAQAGSVTAAQVTGHLRSSGDAIIAVVADLSPEQLEAGHGRARRLATIAIRHADDHRKELSEALAADG